MNRPAEDRAPVRENTAVVHPLEAEPGSPLARWFERWSHPPYFRPLVAPLPLPVARVSAAPDVLDKATAGLPDGAARAEAVAVRLRRLGLRIEVGSPDRLPDTRALLRRCRDRGAASVEVVRADPSLLPELQVGSWFHCSVRMRALRASLRRLPLSSLGLEPPALVALSCDLAFWSGVRSAATRNEWRRLTGSSYVCLAYHRIAGESKPGQERLDLSRRTFQRQMRLLRLLRFRPLSPEELLRFHSDPESTLARRSYVVTADDGFADAAEALGKYLAHRPHLYVPTAAVGGSAGWAGGEPLAGWDELRALEQRGAVVASHGRMHRVLTELADGPLDEELARSLDELRARLADPPPFLAYPHGRHDTAVRTAAERAGYRLAYTTRPGRNGAGTDPYSLRRVGIKDWDGGASFVWKVATGEHVPKGWERLRLRRRSVAASAGDEA